jgi:sulfotransferase 6B1
MAIIQKNNFDKYVRYAKKRLSIQVNSLKFDAIIGRFVGPKVLLISIPKSGTHMLEGILEQMHLLRNAGWKTIMSNPSAYKKIRKIRKGMFANSHLHYSRNLENFIDKQGIKVIFMIRDPRDIVISRYKYITNIDFTHPAHRYFVNTATDHERLLMSINGIDGVILSIRDVLLNFEGWLNTENVKTVRFEDLVGSRGNGQDESRINTIRSIASYLDLKISDSRIRDIDQLQVNKNSSTRRQGKIGGWINEFDRDHESCFNEIAGALTQKYGYEDG